MAIARARRAAALVLLSGGIDSAVVALMALARHDRVDFLSFDYRQANRRELSSARRLVRRLKPRAAHFVVDLDLRVSARAGRSRLLHGGADGGGGYGYYVPGRNLIFFAHASSIAEAHDYETIYVGSNLQDALGGIVAGRRGARRGYPDSGPAFLIRLSRVLRAGLKYAHGIRLAAPLLTANKFEALRYGHARDLDFKLTWSCYVAGSRACGMCPACQARLVNFHWAGLTDPIAYAVPQTIALARALGDETGIADRAMTRALNELRALYARRRTPLSIEEAQRRIARASGNDAAAAERSARICRTSVSSYNYWTQASARRRAFPISF